MNFISETPENRYTSFVVGEIVIMIDQNDFESNTQEEVGVFCKKHGYLLIPNKPSMIYYLRGHLKRAEYSKVLIGILEAPVLPQEINEIIHCLTFWNQEGEACYKMNGEPYQSYEDFILQCIAADCRAFVVPYSDKFLTGKGGNHVWVCDKSTGERILLIHF